MRVDRNIRHFSILEEINKQTNNISMSWFLSVSITNKPFAKKIPQVVRMVQNRHVRKQEMQWGNTTTELTILNYVSSVRLVPVRSLFFSITDFVLRELMTSCKGPILFS